MVSDRFSILIDDLGKALKIKLAPDSNQACMIQFPDGIEVRIDPDTLGETIYIWSDLGPIPTAGKYRENVFREALKANGLPPPKLGIFGFNPKTESLLLCEQTTIYDLTAVRLAELIQSFALKAKIWKEGIIRGDVPSFRASEMSQSGSRGGGSGIFGLR